VVHSETKLGLKENWKQFSLLVLVNAFVGSMVGLERTVLPLLAEDAFGVASRTAILSFIATFGVAKALSNLFAGRASDNFGRKRILVLGWLFGLPVPFIIMFAPAWSWIVAANVFLGINQGLAWSSTVIMKIDLVGPKNRGPQRGVWIYRCGTGCTRIRLHRLQIRSRRRIFLFGSGYRCDWLLAVHYFYSRNERSRSSRGERKPAPRRGPLVLKSFCDDQLEKPFPVFGESGGTGK